MQNYWRGLVGVQCLPFLGWQRRHRARHRRVDFRIAEVGAARLEIGLGLLNLGDDRVHLGIFHRGLGFRLLQSLLANGIDGEQILIAFEILFGQNRLGLLLVELGAQTIQPGFARLDLGLIDARVDLGEQLALGHGIADVNVDRL